MHPPNRPGKRRRFQLVEKVEGRRADPQLRRERGNRTGRVDLHQRRRPLLATGDLQFVPATLRPALFSTGAKEWRRDNRSASTGKRFAVGKIRPRNPFWST